MPSATSDSAAVLVDSSLWVHQDRGRAAGVTAPVADLLIFACAREHRLDLAHDDSHFTQLEQLDA